MSYAAKWSSNTITKQIAVHHMTKYGHLLKWSEYQEICLEVGCGEGTITKEIFYPWIKDRIQKLVAIDKLDGMIKFAKEHNSAEKLEYHTLDIMDNNMTKGMKNQYDHVFSICVDHLITDTRYVQTKNKELACSDVVFNVNRSYASILHSLLKPGGQTFIITIADNFFKHSLDIMYRREKWSKYKPQQPIFTEYTANPVDYLSNILRNTGFNINECEHEKMSFVTEDFKGGHERCR